MSTKTWKDINKFRLFTMIALSILTSLSLSITDELWRMKDVMLAFIHAAITGFAYMQCPTNAQFKDLETREKTKEENE